MEKNYISNIEAWKSSMKLFLITFFSVLILGTIVPFLFKTGTYVLFPAMGIVIKIIIFLSLPGIFYYIHLTKKKNPIMFIVFGTFFWLKEKNVWVNKKLDIFFLVLTVLFFLIVFFLWSSISVLMLILTGKNILEGIIIFLLVCVLFYSMKKN